MKVTHKAAGATSSNQCFLRHYTMQLRFGSAMSFDNRLIAARCIGGAWSLGEAHSQHERLWNGRLWPRKADVGMWKSFSSPNEKPSVKLRRPDGSCDKPKRWHRLYSKTPTAQRAFEAADLPGWCHRFSTAVDRAAFAGSMIGFGHAKLFCGAGKFCTGTICNLGRLMI
jgi:hypothetical protein